MAERQEECGVRTRTYTQLLPRDSSSNSSSSSRTHRHRITNQSATSTRSFLEWQRETRDFVVCCIVEAFAGGQVFWLFKRMLGYSLHVAVLLHVHVTYDDNDDDGLQNKTIKTRRREQVHDDNVVEEEEE